MDKKNITGEKNSGDWNSGIFCSNEPKIRLFNKEKASHEIVIGVKMCISLLQDELRDLQCPYKYQPSPDTDYKKQLTEWTKPGGGRDKLRGEADKWIERKKANPHLSPYQIQVMSALKPEIDEYLMPRYLGEWSIVEAEEGEG
jgi:hypothetical protein